MMTQLSKSQVLIDWYVQTLIPRLDLLIVCLSKAWGGLEQVSVQDAVQLAELGLKVRFLCCKNSPIEAALKEQSKIRTYSIDYVPRNFADFRLKSVLDKLTSEGVNSIHMHQPSLLGSVVPWIWQKQGVSLVVSRHIMNNHDKQDLFHRLLYSRVDGLLVMSQSLRQNVLATHALTEKQVRVVNLGLDFERFNPVNSDGQAQRQEWGVAPGTLVVGLVGRIDPAKGQSVLIRAAAGLKKTGDFPVPMKFVIVGEETLGKTSNYFSELKSMVKQFRLEDDILFAGYKKNIPEVMRAFDILVMPSKEETFGLVAIEAMAMECPIIISAVGSCEEIIGDEEYGLKVIADDAFDLRRQLLTLLHSPELRQSMGKRAREFVMLNYDRKVRIQKSLEIYDKYLKKRNQ